MIALLIVTGVIGGMFLGAVYERLALTHKADQRDLALTAICCAVTLAVVLNVVAALYACAAPVTAEANDCGTSTPVLHGSSRSLPAFALNRGGRR